LATSKSTIRQELDRFHNLFPELSDCKVRLELENNSFTKCRIDYGDLKFLNDLGIDTKVDHWQKGRGDGLRPAHCVAYSNGWRQHNQALYLLHWIGTNLQAHDFLADVVRKQELLDGRNLGLDGTKKRMERELKAHSKLSKTV